MLTSQKGFSPILVILLVVVVGGIAAGSFYLGKTSSKTVSLSDISVDKKIESKENNEWKTYSKGNLTFSYPNDWEVLNEVPQEYREIKYDMTKDGWDKEHLKSKMFVDTCRGPILRNTQVKSTIIAFEVIDKSSDGGFCWSRGDFTNSYTRTITSLTPPKEITVSKWSTGEYMYPITQDNSGKKYSPEWQGELFQQVLLDAQNTKLMPVIALVYKNGTDTSAESTFDKILPTIKVSQ